MLVTNFRVSYVKISASVRPAKLNSRSGVALAVGIDGPAMPHTRTSSL